MSDIAKALDRPPSYPTKYFGCELGAQTTIDHKTDKYIVNGSHTADKMQDILDGFIQKFVLCPKCENPETTLTVHKQSISQRCMACGERGLLKIVHRLTQFIYKNPPNSNLTENGAGRKDAKKNKGKKGNKKDSDSEDEKGSNNDSIIAQNYQDADRNGDQDSPPPVAEDSDDEEWAEETQETAEIEPQLSSMTLSSNTSERSHEEKLEMFYNFVENKKQGGNIASEHKELYGEAEKLDIVDKAVSVLTEVLLGENILRELPAYRNIFLRFCHKNPKSQKKLLQCLEMLICKRYADSLLPRTAHILKGLYDLDIVEEAVLIEWHEKVEKSSRKRLGAEMFQEIHNKAAPFIKWLKEAEEESGSEEESDEEEGPEVEIEYSYQATSGLQESKVKPAAAEEDDDLDIDNI